MFTGLLMVEKYRQTFTRELYLYAHDYWRLTVFTGRNNFINFSPGFVIVKPGLNSLGILHWRDSQVARGLISLQFFAGEITGVGHTGALNRVCLIPFQFTTL